MPELTTQPAELHFTIDIKRAETGETETVELVGIITHKKDIEDVSNT